MNQVQLVGNLARDPDYRTLQSGITYCQFTVACQRKFKNQSGAYEADFINCVAWRERADFVHKYFLKGQKIGLTGTLQVRSYDAQDGTKRYVTEINADSVEALGGKSDSSGGNSSSGASAPTPPPPTDAPAPMPGDFQEVDDDELPF